MLSFFPRGVLDEILSLIESVSEDFPSYSIVGCKTGISLFSLNECTGRAIALPPASALAAASTWTKCLSFTLKFLYDGQGVVGRAIL